MTNEPPDEPIRFVPAVSADLIITWRGRPMVWLERLLGKVVIPFLEWRARRALRRTR